MANVVTEEQEVIKIGKQELFNVLAAENPTEYAGKAWADVETIEEDPDDATFIRVVFKP